MTKITALITCFLGLCAQIVAQEIAPPVIQQISGFYTSDFLVEIEHDDPEIMILFTLDGSWPKYENITGKEWEYKTHYPITPSHAVGSLLKDTLWTYLYTQPIQVKDRTNEPSIIPSIATSARKNGGYAAEHPFRGTVIRAVAYDQVNNTYSETITRNFYITPAGDNRYQFPVASISVDNDELYSYEYGIYVPGIEYDNWRAENPNDESMYWLAPGNFYWKGSETEKPIHFSYIENGQEVIEQGAGLRLNGNSSRTYPLKSYRLYAKSGYGKKNFKHQFFQNYDYNKFKRLILRTGGNETSYSIIKDAFIHDLTRNLNFNIQEFQPSVVFINGEYNGIRNVRERYDKKYFDRKHGVDEDSLDFIKVSTELNVKEGDDLFYNEMLNFLRNNDLSQQAEYDQALEYFDPINQTDYFITNVFVVNTDWLNNNYQCWRKRVDFTPDAPYGQDGRFRWNLQDDDISFGYAEDYTYKMLEWATSDFEEIQNEETRELYQNAALITRSLLKNENYKHYFINRYADLMNTTFKAERMVNNLNAFRAKYEPEIEENNKRWNTYVADVPLWNSYIDNLVDFAENRPSYQKANLLEYFDLAGMYDLVLNVNDTLQGYIHLNSIDILSTTDGIEEMPYLWLGEYFKNIPITVHAVAKEGYKFSHWSGVSNDTTAIITLELNEDSYLKAHFEVDPSSGLQEEFISNTQELDLVLYPNPAKNTLFLLSDVAYVGASYSIFNTMGRTVATGKINGTTIDIEHIEKGHYFIAILTKDGKITKQFFKE